MLPVPSKLKSVSSFSFLRGMTVYTSTRKAEHGGYELKVCFSYIAGLPPKPKGGEGQWSSFCELNTQKPGENPGMVAQACDPSTGRVETGGFLGLAPWLDSFRTVTERSEGREKADGV